MSGPTESPTNGRDIQILPSTFNGERYLFSQLNSLRNQSIARRIKVLIRDDGSTDSTLTIINSFDGGNLKIDLIRGNNIGTKQSFLELMKAADLNSSVFMFCDQDDVWLPTKVEQAVITLSEFPDSVPCLYCCRSFITDTNLNRIGITNPVRKPSFRNSLIQNIAPGHTMAANRALLELAACTMDPQRVIMHDNWLYCVASAVGSVSFDNRALALYRNHSANQIGYRAGHIARLFDSVSRLFNIDRAIYTAQDKCLYEAMSAVLSDEKRELLAGFLNQDSPIERIRYCCKSPLLHQSRFATIIANILYILGRYRLKQ
jgi:glycosyltransferase involved in cell wall biosynthesis